MSAESIRESVKRQSWKADAANRENSLRKNKKRTVSSTEVRRGCIRRLLRLHRFLGHLCGLCVFAVKAACADGSDFNTEAAEERRGKLKEIVGRVMKKNDQKRVHTLPRPFRRTAFQSRSLPDFRPSGCTPLNISQNERVMGLCCRLVLPVG